MQALLFEAGPARYALPLAALTRVLPAAALAALPGAPPAVAGLLDLHGAPVPVLDLAVLAGAPAAAACFDTRILLLDYPSARGPRALGLLAPHVLGLAAVADGAWADAGIAGPPWLGRVASTDGALVHALEPAGLLDAALQALLFPEAA
ncbi:MAG: chemotaxis protein CheW [Telluria sp.]